MRVIGLNAQGPAAELLIAPTLRGSHGGMHGNGSCGVRASGGAALCGAGTRPEAAQRRLHHGRRHRVVQHRGLPPGNDGRPDTEPRPPRVRGDDVHRLLRRGQLHRRTRQLHHRRAAHPHRADDGGTGRLTHRDSRAGGHHRHHAESHGVRHRPVREEPPRGPERVSSHGARLRRVLRVPLSPRRDGGPLPPELSPRAQGHCRPETPGPQLGTGQGRRDGAAPLGKGRQAADRGCGGALPRAHEDDR